MHFASAMDLGCLDLGCVSVAEKQSDEACLHSENKESEANESVVSSSKIGKNKASKETGMSTVNALNKFTSQIKNSQIKKPPHRKVSPINWFPRKKVDSYLKRKIKLLQELGGMSSTLDETLGDSNPHYTRVEREKIAAREAAQKAMQARKAAMIEASWCRILRAARIQSKEAEALLLTAERDADEDFEAAIAMGVIMYDIPNCSRKPCEIESSSIHGGGSTTHTVAASFETAFEVDKEVAAAVKIAFIRLANCPPINKDEFKDLLRTICQNPDMGENDQELSGFSSEYESDTGSELELGYQKDESRESGCNMSAAGTRERKYRKRQFSNNFNMAKLVDMLIERLKCLQEEELASLATIVATCGLNAALAEVENSKQQHLGSTANVTSGAPPNFIQRMSSLGARTVKMPNTEGLDWLMRTKQVESEVPSSDKILVKHMSKLEAEVLEAKNARMNESRKETERNPYKSDDQTANLDNNIHSPESVPDLGSILVKRSSRLEKEIEEAKQKSRKLFQITRKDSLCDATLSENAPDLGSILIKHSSKLEKEVEVAKRNRGKTSELNGKKLGIARNGLLANVKQDVPDVPSLDKFLVKHVSKLEREVQEAKNKRKNDSVEDSMVADSKKKTANSSYSEEQQLGKENIDLNKDADGKSRMEQKDCTMTLHQQNNCECSNGSLIQVEQVDMDKGETLSLEDEKAGSKETKNSLHKILIKPVHRLEREKMQALSSISEYEFQKHNKKLGGNRVTDCESLDKVLVKHISKLERAKMECTSKEEFVNVKRRNTNVQVENNEGSLDQILVKHTSRLEREKVAAAQEPKEPMKYSLARREARERALQETWGGMSLGNSMKPHLSRLERDKAAWIKAEEEERRLLAMKEM